MRTALLFAAALASVGCCRTACMPGATPAAATVAVPKERSPSTSAIPPREPAVFVLTTAPGQKLKYYDVSELVPLARHAFRGGTLLLPEEPSPEVLAANEQVDALEADLRRTAPPPATIEIKASVVVARATPEEHAAIERLLAERRAKTTPPK